MKVISSVQYQLANDYLRPRLENAVQYDRISGYFCSSIFQCTGDIFSHFESEGSIRMVCNSKVQWDDIQVARQAISAEWKQQHAVSEKERSAYAQSQLALDWSSNNPRFLVSDKCPEKSKNMERFGRLYELLSTKKLIVRVLPSSISLPSGKTLSLLHGKAGMITDSLGKKSVFYTSANDSSKAWESNYEILCEADTKEEMRLAEEDFALFWNHPAAVDLAECNFIMRDIHGLSKNNQKTLDDWLDDPDPVSPFVMLPINLIENGLMLHQRMFIQQVFEEHQTAGGSRLILADDVGLGKTLSLAGAAMLTFLLDRGKKPVLIVCPPNLMRQWQAEMYDKFGIKSCFWNNTRWILENEELVAHPFSSGEMVYARFGNMPKDIYNPPRQFIIVSTGLFIQNSTCKDKVDALLQKEYSCIILDEGHKASRENSGGEPLNKKAKYGFLYRNLRPFAEKTHSFLIGTATPVQLHPIEAADLLELITWSRHEPLGSHNSLWRSWPTVLDGLKYSVKEPTHLYPSDFWNWIRDPLPPGNEDSKVFYPLRVRLGVESSVYVIEKALQQIPNTANNIVRTKICDNNYPFFTMHNPYIRHIVRRTRDALETHYDDNGVPILPKINIRTVDGVVPDFYSSNTYDCLVRLVLEVRNRNSVRQKNFMPALVAENLLRRVSSSQSAGLKSLERMVNNHCEQVIDFDDDLIAEQDLKKVQFTDREIALLQEAHAHLKSAIGSFSIDPKSEIMFDLLKFGALVDGLMTPPWMDLGCILFSQYYDTAEFFAENLYYRLPNDPLIGLYAGGGKSAVYSHGQRMDKSKEELIRLLNSGELKILFATDAACEGLNLQMLSTLVNIDLPWNPTKLSQRVGRIRRTKQKQHTVYVCNLRYKGTVEDKVYGRLCQRFAKIYDFFGSKPDYFEDNDIWQKALDPKRDNELKHELRSFSDEIKHPFQLRYDAIFQSGLNACRKYDWANRDDYLLFEELFTHNFE